MNKNKRVEIPCFKKKKLWDIKKQLSDFLQQYYFFV